jgi:hypothetical protein
MREKKRRKRDVSVMIVDEREMDYGKSYRRRISQNGIRSCLI